MNRKMLKRILKRKIDFLKQPVAHHLFHKNHKQVHQYARFYDQLPVQKNTIFYETRDGESITDSPYAMFQYMLTHPDYSEYTHIWAVKDFNSLSSVMAKYREYPNVRFVKRNSTKYLKDLATCEYLINNSTFQTFFIPKSDQTYINTWHGTPLKYMGFDIPGNPSNSQNVVRNFLGTSYLLSPNAHTTKVFSESYKLNGLYQGKIIEEGYPRIDLTLNTDRNEFRQNLQKCGLWIDENKETLLYAPTWKGTSTSKANNDLPQIIADLNHLERELGHQYNLLVKVHPFLYKEAVKYSEIQNRLVPDFIDTNELLSIVDVLVTDYSSIFFDFLVTNKPILFYTWDLDVYSEERGQYLPNEDLPGPMVMNCNELIHAIHNIETVKQTYRERYHKMKETFTHYEDGKVTERIVHHIFHNTPEKLNTVSCSSPGKQKILIYSGGMKNNGITSSFINLLNNIDYSQFDVSCFTKASNDREILNNLSKINENVRFLFKPGLPVYKLLEVYRDKFIYNRGAGGTLGKAAFPEEAYIRENARIFGKSEFDYVIDFSGYSLYWAKYLAVLNAKKKICFMHSDLLSDSERTVNGKRPHRINLRGLFTIYNRFDKLVSVSRGTMEVNREKLARYADYEKFDYVMNSISPDKILEMAARNTEYEAEMEQNRCSKLVSIESILSRALITDSHRPAWNALPNDSNAVAFKLGKSFDQAEIMVSRKASMKQGTYYKFSFRHQVIGWIDARSITLMPDSIIYEKDVNQIAKIAWPRNHDIFTAPYKVENAEKVSGSWDYKDVVVEIDKVAETQHGTYSRILINKTPIGWISNSALTVLDRCTIEDTTGSFKRIKNHLNRKAVIIKNHRKYHGLIDHIENRTLKEISMDRPLFAKIAKPEGYSIWTKAYPNFHAKKAADAGEFEGRIVKITTIQETKEGQYYLFYVEQQKVGWLDARAFEILERPTLIIEREVARIAEVKWTETDQVWDRPYGLQDARPTLENAKVLDGSIVRVDKEVMTQVGTYSHIIKNGMALGWLDNRSLIVKEILGVEVDGQFIPGPTKDHINFVTMGRLSPEKGFDNLIRAFARFREEHEKSKLYILGHGPLKNDLSALIEELDVKDSVHLMGQLDNPFAFMSQCDTFVLSSHYEGQPMVLLEAMTLGMKIVATDIIANRTVLEEGKYGLLVEDSIDGLEQGLHVILNKEKPEAKERFDYNQYNAVAMASFYKSLS